MRRILVVLLAGCGAADGTDTEKAPLPPMGEPGQPSAGNKAVEPAASDCPLALPGAEMRSEVTANGVALVFTSSGDDGAELRDRAQRMADRHNAAAPAAEPSATGKGAPPSRAAVEEIAGGARVVFTPTDPAKVAVLREHIRVHGREMAEAGCGEEAAPAKVAPAPPAPPSGGDKTAPAPTPTPTPDEPDMPDRPVTPDQPVSPPTPPPPPPTGVPFDE